jgi:hypothetical protein
MTFDLDLRSALEIGSACALALGLLWKTSARNAQLQTRETCTATHVAQCNACALKHQQLDAVLSDLRDETRAELGRRAQAVTVERLDATSIEHGRTIERLDAKIDGLTTGQERIEKVCDHIATRLDAIAARTGTK